MGFFDDVANLANEMHTFGEELTQFGSDFVKEVLTEADSVKQTATETSTELSAVANDISTTIGDSVTLSPDTSDTTDAIIEK